MIVPHSDPGRFDDFDPEQKDREGEEQVLQVSTQSWPDIMCTVVAGAVQLTPGVRERDDVVNGEGNKQQRKAKTNMARILSSRSGEY